MRPLELSREEELMLKGEYGDAIKEAIEIIVKVGDVLGAQRLVKISHAHASGVSYGTIGEPGLHWLRSLAERGAKVRVYSTINPIGMDLEDPTKVPVDISFYKKQMEILDAFVRMGFERSVTCTPYYLRKPRPRERLAWGESSAVAYANSVLGAFTNREGGPVAVAAALTGRIYEAGLQVLENRTTTHVIKNQLLNDPAEWGALGLIVGEVVGGGIPRYLQPPRDEVSIKDLLAASAASGGVALSVLDGITPTGTYKIGEEEKIEVDMYEIEKKLSVPDDADLIFHGCPHASIDELETINKLIKNPIKREFWVAVSPRVYGMGKRSGVVDSLESKGVKVVQGTCSVVTPIEKMGFKKVLTTSAKTLFYLKKKGLDVGLVRLRDLGEL